MLSNDQRKLVYKDGKYVLATDGKHVLAPNGLLFRYQNLRSPDKGSKISIWNAVTELPVEEILLPHESKWVNVSVSNKYAIFNIKRRSSDISDLLIIDIQTLQRFPFITSQSSVFTCADDNIIFGAGSSQLEKIEIVDNKPKKEILRFPPFIKKDFSVVRK